MSDQAEQLRGIMEQRRSQGATVCVQELPIELHGKVSSAHLPRSIPTGALSYGPICSRPRPTISPSRANVVAAPVNHLPRLAKAIAVASGKGGVGKSNIAVNLAVAMSQLGLKVCLLDADLGLANADLLCNLSPQLTLEHVVAGRCRLADAMMLAPGGFRLIPGASGVSRMADLGSVQRRRLVEQLVALEEAADILLIDCGAGISGNVVGFASAANAVLVATTPEPTAITDGYAMIKAIVAQRKATHSLMERSAESLQKSGIQLVINMAEDEAEGAEVFARIERVSRMFLNHSLEFGATIERDAAIPNAVRQRVPFVLHAPEARATSAIRSLAATLAGLEFSGAAAAQVPAERIGFFSRLAVWLGIVEYVD